MDDRVENDANLSRKAHDLDALISVAAALNAEKDIRRLLELILEQSRKLTSADAGSVYVVENVKKLTGEKVSHLRFEVAQNDSLEIDFASQVIPISPSSIVGSAAIRRMTINIADMRNLAEEAPGLIHDNSFDDATGYQTRSVLAVPMINARDEVIGVIQLINCKTQPEGCLEQPPDFNEMVVPFDRRSEDLAKTLAYQAGIALDNALLLDELKQVFEGFVEASVLAIEARDPTTSGHSRRVANLTVGLAKAADRTTDGPYKDLHFSADELKEIEYAGLLHDFGKVGVPEQVLVKAEKLYPWDKELIISRFDYIRQWLRAEKLEQELRLIRSGDRQLLRSESEELASRFRDEEHFVDQCVRMILRANKPSVLEEDTGRFLEALAERRYRNPRGEMLPYLNESEIECLKVRRGSLNADERLQIESHVVHSFNFLCKIPWGRGFRRIPEIARDHHEKLDGTGYPSKLSASEIPPQARMMTIADIFDALTASDRPYKPALPLEKALDILRYDVEAKKLDADLFAIFLGARIFEKI